MNQIAEPGGAKIECPRCGREVPAAAECAGCGIVFDKYRSRHRRPVQEADAPGPAPATGARSPLPRTLLVLLGLSVAIFAYDRSRDESAGAAAVARPGDGAQAGFAAPRAPGSPHRAAGRAPASTSELTVPTATGPLDGQPPPIRPPAAMPPRAQPPAARQPDFEPDAGANPSSEPPTERPSTYSSYSWYEDADGFARGLEEAMTDGRALAVYFHTDWCGYCRQLESELLERARVESYLKYLTKVRINPESGRTERAIADRYGVTGYPSFFVHPAADRRPTKVSGMKRRHGEWRVKSPSEFVETIRRVVDN